MSSIKSKSAVAVEMNIHAAAGVRQRKKPTLDMAQADLPAVCGCEGKTPGVAAGFSVRFGSGRLCYS